MMVDDFVLRGLGAGIGIALVGGPLGCFIVWRRMAYFGDAMAHSALLGVALGFLLGIDLVIGVVASGLALALFVVTLQRHGRLAADTLLGIFAHTALALGMVVLSLMPGVRVDLMGYLFGDILAVAPADLYWIYGVGAAVLAGLVILWRPLLAATISEEMARAEGVPVTRVRLGLMILVAAVIAIAMKIVGILLITSLLIIPAAAARRFARTPETMAVLAALLGAVAVTGGLMASLRWDTPAGPSVVVAAAVVFALVLAAGGLARGHLPVVR